MPSIGNNIWAAAIQSNVGGGGGGGGSALKGATYIYSSDTDGGLYRINISNSSTTALGDIVSDVGIAVHQSEQKVYWLESGVDALWKVNLDGTSNEQVVAVPRGVPFVLALDEDNNKAYIGTIVGDEVFEVNLLTDAITGLADTLGGDVQGIATYNGRVYVHVENPPLRILEISSDGSTTDVTPTGLDVRSALGILAIDDSVDPPQQYVLDADDKIYKAELDGSNVTSVVAVGHNDTILFGMAIDKKNRILYIGTQSGDDRVLTFNIDTGVSGTSYPITAGNTIRDLSLLLET